MKYPTRTTGAQWLLCGLMIILIVTLTLCVNQSEEPLVFVSWFENEKQMGECVRLCESIRTFAGAMHRFPIHVYYHETFHQFEENELLAFGEHGVILTKVEIPGQALKYALGAKPFIAARAEIDLENRAQTLAFLDANIIIIGEPGDFLLAEDRDIAYKPVFHKNIGSLFAEQPDAFWSRVYTALNVSEQSLFPMEAVADKQVLRPYFNAGLLVVHPERQILRNWWEAFQILYGDQEVAVMASKGLHNVFLHQAALTGAILNHVKREKMVLLPFAYNYPLFFDKFWDSTMSFNSVENIVSLKCEVDYDKLPPDWRQMIEGQDDVVSWLQDRLGR